MSAANGSFQCPSSYLGIILKLCSWQAWAFFSSHRKWMKGLLFSCVHVSVPSCSLLTKIDSKNLIPRKEFVFICYICFLCKATREWSIEGSDIITNYNLIFEFLRTGGLLHRNFFRIKLLHSRNFKLHKIMEVTGRKWIRHYWFSGFLSERTGDMKGNQKEICSKHTFESLGCEWSGCRVLWS